MVIRVFISNWQHFCGNWSTPQCAKGGGFDCRLTFRDKHAYPIDFISCRIVLKLDVKVLWPMTSLEGFTQSLATCQPTFEIAIAHVERSRVISMAIQEMIFKVNILQKDHDL